jgi:GT2 family glycosyltransferase
VTEPVDLSIIIVSYNTKKLLSDCLASLHQGQSRYAVEVVVIDNGSTDGSPEMVEEAFPKVRLIGNSDNRGFAAANNQGIRSTTGRYVLLLNSDTIVSFDCIDGVVEFMESTPQAAAAGPRLIYPDGTFQPSAYRYSLRPFKTLVEAFHLKSVFPRLGVGLITDEDSLEGAIPVAWIMGAFLMLRRPALDIVGLLDEDYFMYAEETDLLKRIQLAGYSVFYIPDRECIHIGGASWENGQQIEKVSPARINAMLKSQMFYVRKHHGAFASALYGLGSLMTALNGIVWWELIRLIGRKAGEAKSKQHLLRYRTLLHASTALLFRRRQSVDVHPTTLKQSQGDQ